MAQKCVRAALEKTYALRIGITLSACCQVNTTFHVCYSHDPEESGEVLSQTYRQRIIILNIA